jgi:hypothetical protein
MTITLDRLLTEQARAPFPQGSAGITKDDRSQ